MSKPTATEAMDLLTQCARLIGTRAYVDSNYLVQQTPQYEKLPSLVHELIEIAEGRTFTIEQVGDVAHRTVIGFWFKHCEIDKANAARETIQMLLSELQKEAFNQRNPKEIA